jgi:cytochrome c oxidase subunit I+III
VTHGTHADAPPHAAPAMQPVDPADLHRRLERIWGTGPGWARLSAVNHTVLGRRFIITAAIFFAIGGVLAMLIRAQLATSRSAFVGPEIYSQIFTMHGTIMMFLFAIPMIEGLAIYLLPKMLGARDLAFPRLTAYGYWCYFFGGSILITAMLAGVAPDGGWFMYPPLTSRQHSPEINVDVWLLGVTFVEISAICAAVEIFTSILKLRAPGMSLDRMPLIAWYLLVTAGMMIVAFPPLILGSILLEVERAFDWPFFDSARGGDPLLWQHLFWLFGHPEVYIIFLPAAGVVSTILPVFARRPIVGYTWLVIAVIALGFLSFGLWVHHMFTTGIPHLALGFFSAASMLVVIPTGVQIFAWLATLVSGRPELKLPMLFILGFFGIFVLGGLTGVMVAVVPFDWQVHDTHFVVAHLHYVLVGGFVFPILAAAYYWIPHVTGRRSVYGLGYGAFWLIFIGFNLTFFQMHLTGLLGMPRRVHAYPAELGWDGLNLLSSIGGFVTTIGFALFAVDMLLQSRFGIRTTRNPWGADSLEWAMPLPPTSYAFASLPKVESRAPLHDNPALGARLASGRGYLGFARNDQMETLSVHMVTGKIEQVLILPSSTYKPLWTALATGTVFLGLLFKIYWLSFAGFAATILIFLTWTQGRGLRRDLGLLGIGRGASAPTQYEGPNPPSWWGLVFALIANSFFFGSLLFGFVFLWVVAPGWPPPVLLNSGFLASLLVSAGLISAAWSGHAALAANSRGEAGRRGTWLLIGAAAHVLALAEIGWLIFRHLPDPTIHAYAATSTAILGYVALHVFMGAIFALYGLHRGGAGYLSPARSLDLRIALLWHDYAAATGLLALVLLFAMPLVIGR